MNAFLSYFGVQQRNWMLDTTINAWIFIILINGFIGASMGMIIFSSAITSIPKQILFASEEMVLRDYNKLYILYYLNLNGLYYLF